MVLGLLHAQRQPDGLQHGGDSDLPCSGHGRKGQAEPSLGSCLPSRRSAQRRHKG